MPEKHSSIHLLILKKKKMLLVKMSVKVLMDKVLAPETHCLYLTNVTMAVTGNNRLLVEFFFFEKPQSSF